MITIGITGGIGSGKSEICAFLEKQYDALILKADDIGHDVMDPGGCAYQPVIELFGESVVCPDGHLDRKKIGDLVFDQPDLLQKLNRIVHPAVHETITTAVHKAQTAGRALCVIEAALLIEADYRDVCMEYWYVHVPYETRVKRLLASRDITPEKIESIKNRQLTEESFRKACEFELENGNDFEKTKSAAMSRIEYLRSLS